MTMRDENTEATEVAVLEAKPKSKPKTKAKTKTKPAVKKAGSGAIKRTDKEWENIEKKRAATMKKNGISRGRKGLSTKVVIRIKQALRNGMRQSKIAEKAGISRAMVSAIKSGRAWSTIKIPK